MHTTPIRAKDEERLVGSDRVLAVLSELARHSEGIALDDMARAVRSPKPTTHRALASLCRAGLADRDTRGHYVLGDEFLRMAFTHHESRPEYLRVQPILDRLATFSGETVHYAVLDGTSVVYRAKVDAPTGAIRLSSTVGGRNPAHSTGVGKLLMAYALPDADAVRTWIGDRTLERPTANTKTTADELHAELVLIRERGYSVDDQENEAGVNCIAVPVFLASPSIPSGAISVSALAYRTSLQTLVHELPTIRLIVSGQPAPE